MQPRFKRSAFAALLAAAFVCAAWLGAEPQSVVQRALANGPSESAITSPQRARERFRSYLSPNLSYSELIQEDQNDSPKHLRPLWPVEAMGVTSLFGPRMHPVHGERRFHYGIDLAAARGDVVRAVRDGMVDAAAWMGGHGRRVVVRHDDGIVTAYSHLAEMVVRRGQRVVTGQVLGFVGSSGAVTGPHLHFEVLRRGRFLDPWAYLSGEPTRRRGQRVARRQGKQRRARRGVSASL